MNRKQIQSLKTSGARVYEEYLHKHTALAIYAEKRADFFRGAAKGRETWNYWYGTGTYTTR